MVYFCLFFLEICKLSLINQSLLLRPLEMQVMVTVPQQIQHQNSLPHIYSGYEMKLRV